MKNQHSSLPVEYQLKYGTACGNANLEDFVNNASGHSLMNTLELVSDELERKGLLAGLEDARRGRVQSLDEIEAELERKSCLKDELE